MSTNSNISTLNAIETANEDFITQNPQYSGSHPIRIRDLSVLAYAQGFTLWHYKLKPTDIPVILTSPNWANSTYDMFASGDIIHFSGDTWAASRLILKNGNTIIFLPLL